jgi:16S rRNA A1518/A1519 N6-dimethyltransferase RsmA/KsgA/DIM1 with predicted DNA glycosylase/AP lyase activity
VGGVVNTQIATNLNFKYEIVVVERYDSRDFSPVPNVNIVLLKIKRRKGNMSDFSLFRDFVTYIFNQTNARVGDTLRRFLQRSRWYIFLRNWIVEMC